MSDYLGVSNTGWPANLNAQKVILLAGATGASEIIPTYGRALVGLVMPAAWNAAAIQYYGTLSGNARELKALKDGNTSVLLQTLVAAGDWIVFPLPDAFFGTFLQLVSVTAASVNVVQQDADREIVLLFKNFLD